MKIAIIGYGKMGKEIESIAIARGHEIVARFSTQHALNADELKKADVAIEFTKPDTAPENLTHCLQNGVPVVCGTTGWYDHFETIATLCKTNNGSLFTATNFSLGVNITFALNEWLAKIMAGQSGYRAGITEIHHTRKLDAPSGTGLTLAQGIIRNNPHFEGWKLESACATADSGQVPIHAIREGEVPGTHVVTWESEIDTLKLEHIAHSRKGFALGAVLASEWLIEHKGVFGMQDMLNFDAVIR
ncbi:MAG: 4-hydroxy-tetrahydrodipicolinate reductase [Bacteroidetes bacterium]|nr:4-hydroxy-tetrahydrodipicolinate reductase [Bacteroidota bacterium]